MEGSVDVEILGEGWRGLEVWLTYAYWRISNLSYERAGMPWKTGTEILTLPTPMSDIPRTNAVEEQILSPATSSAIDYESTNSRTSFIHR